MSLMGIDIGTSGCKAVVFSENGRELSQAYREYDQICREPGQAELNAREVWQRIREVIIEASTASADPVKGLSVTSMGEAIVPVDDKGDICGNSILGLDNRGDIYINQASNLISAKEIYKRTGNLPATGFSVFGLCWLRDTIPDTYRQTNTFFSWADFVCYKLTGRKCFSSSLACRTLLYNINNKQWDEEIGCALGVDISKFPPVMTAGSSLGEIEHSIADEIGLPYGLEVFSGTHDQCAAALGCGVNSTDSIMLGLGTFACAVLVHRQTGEDSAFRRLNLNIEEHALLGQYVSFIYHGSGGALIKWLREQFFRDIDGADTYRRMFAEASASLRIHPNVLPYFTGTGPLDCVAGGNGIICGLSLKNTRGDILRGALEGIVLYFKDALSRLADMGHCVKKIHVTGGGSKSAFWLQLVADILGLPVVRTLSRECGALGAAILAAVNMGYYPSINEAVENMVNEECVFLPAENQEENISQLIERYRKLREMLFTDMESVG